MIEKVTALLTNENAWTASNAALVLARLTISESGCTLLLDNQYSKAILSQLIDSLGTDEAGEGNSLIIYFRVVSFLRVVSY